MAFDCCTWIAKYLLCLFNFIFFIVGSIVLAIGVWLHIDKNSLLSLLKSVENEHIAQFTQPQFIEQSTYFLIAAGGVMFFLSFLGYCGAIRESQCMLSLYGICVIIVLVAEIAAVVFAFSYKDLAKEETRKFLQDSIKDYQSSVNQTDASTLMWNHMMAQLKCCGVDNYKDFERANGWIKNKGERMVPEACCVLSEKGGLFEPRDSQCIYAPSTANSYHNKGCYEELLNYLLTNQNIVIFSLIGLGLVQLFAIFLAFCICKSIDKYRDSRL